MSKVRSIVVDTLTAIQEKEWMLSNRRADHDDWMDFGRSIYGFMNDLQVRGFEFIMILGEPGTGKSSGMRTLAHETNIWFNADNKNPVWTGGVAEYGKKNSPIAKYHQIPNSYHEIIEYVDVIKNAGFFEEDRYAFILGHVENTKVGNNNIERLKTLGKVTSKMRLDGAMETTMYSRVIMEGIKPSYILETQNNGANTARSHQGMFERRIPNDYNLILEKLIAGV